MTNETIQPLLELQKQLENAIETREIFLRMGDRNMVLAWEEQLDFICEKIKKGYYAD